MSTLPRPLALLALPCMLLACGEDDYGPSIFALGPYDLGADGGVSDGDSSTDASDTESEATDSGVADAGSVDAGSVDVGSVDAGSADSGVSSTNPLSGMGTVELVASAYGSTSFAFLEGPSWQNGQLVFSDLAAIYAWDATNGVSLVVSDAAGVNGNAVDASGTHIACAMFGRAIATVQSGSLVTLFDTYQGSKLNAPNDIVVSSSGAFYFTDPGFGISSSDYELDFHGVFRYDGSTLTPVWTGSLSQRPNGVGLSPDDTVLYLTDTQDSVVRAFDVASDGTLSGERTFASVERPDGMTVDSAGNVYVSTSSGIAVYAPDGTNWGTISVSQTPSNATFGGSDGKTLFITARGGLYAVSMPIAGISGR